MIRMSSQLETNLVSIERVKEYSDAQTEVGENKIINRLKRTKKKECWKNLIDLVISGEWIFTPIVGRLHEATKLSRFCWMFPQGCN